MKTLKATAKQMKEMGTFKAIKFSKTGEATEATFTIVSDTEAKATFTTGEEKTMKIDSVRRSWEVVEEEEVTEADNTEIETTEQLEAALESAGIEDKEEDAPEADKAPEAEATPEIAVGSFVKMVDGTIGKVNSIHGTLATVELSDGDEVPAKLEALEITEAPKAKKGNSKPKAPQAPKAEKAPKVEAEKVYGGGGFCTTEMGEFTFFEGYSQQLTKEIKTVTKLGWEIVMTEEDLINATISEGVYIEIIEYTGVVTSVKVIDKDEQTVLWKSPKYSIKDLIENYLKFEGERAKEARRAITTLKKQSKTIEKTKAGVVVG